MNPLNKKASTSITLPLIVFAILVLSMGSIGLLQKKALSSPDTSNWKTFRSEKYGYLVKYPSNWVFDSGYDGSDLHLSNKPTTDERLQPDQVVVEIQASHKKSPSMDLYSLALLDVKAGGGLGPSGEVRKMDLYGLPVIQVEHGGGEGPDGPGYYVEKGPEEYFYIFVYNAAAGEEETIHKIISTLRKSYGDERL